ncbi:RNA-binding S4 domain-containing protein [Oceaniovalibus guishaninsula]|uniref:RNA-binding S4 domain-containing protein n=1 Tax=Oceaniovalibus guishaninsula TaxID=1046117 RepID=UPI003B75C218
MDKWLWFARFFKTRSLSARLVAEGGVRINGTRVTKPSASVRAGDALTFAQGDRVRVVRIVAIGARRGPAPEAQALYDDLAPPEGDAPVRRAGARPTKKDRRDMVADRRRHAADDGGGQALE